MEHTIVYPTSPYSSGDPYCEHCDYFEFDHTVENGVCSNDISFQLNEGEE